MMRKQTSMKRLLAIVLAVALAFTMMPLIGGTAYADDALTLELDSESTTFIIGNPVNVIASGGQIYVVYG